MNLKTRILWGFIVSLLCCWGCEDSADDTIELSAGVLFYESSAESQSVNVKSSASWVFHDPAEEWCYIDDNKSGIVSVMVTENTGYKARTTVIRVEAGNCVREIDVVQQGKESKLTLSNDALEVFDKNQTAVVGLLTADAWQVSIAGNWVQAVPDHGTGGQMVRFNFSPNTMDAPRTAIITFSVPDQESKTFVLTQGAKLPDDRMHDSLALVAIYNAANGAEWPAITRDNWLSAKPISQWNGVTMNAAGRVQRLALAGADRIMGETSYLPEEVKYLTNMDELVLAYCGLAGKLPQGLFRCAELKTLSFTGESVRQGRLSGEIPMLIGCLSKLTQLSLKGNQLEGMVPTELGGCPIKMELDLSNNKLTELPTMLDMSVGFASFANNSLTGVIPQEWGTWFRAGAMRVDGNKDLGGELPAIWCENGRDINIDKTNILPCNKK